MDGELDRVHAIGTVKGTESIKLPGVLTVTTTSDSELRACCSFSDLPGPTINSGVDSNLVGGTRRRRETRNNHVQEVIGSNLLDKAVLVSCSGCFMEG